MGLPSNVSTGMVIARYIADIIDGPDPDQEPDTVPVQGRIVFTKSVPYLPNPTADPSPVTILQVPIVGVLDGDGVLCTPYPGTLEPQYRGVRLIATDDPDIAVQNWTWDVTYIFEPVNGHKLAIPAHGFSLPSGETVDLTKVAKVPSSPGYSLPQAEAAVLRAEAIAQSIRDDADAGLFNGEAATLEIGSVSSGTTAEVVNVGDEQHAILNITLEKGDKGDTGNGVPNSGAPFQLIRMDGVAGTTEWVTPSKELVGLTQVDNTADADKPVSGPVELALAGKADLGAVEAIEPDSGARAVGKGELLVNVRDYGATGDGITDDSDALEAAVNATVAGNATLHWPKGSYLTSGSIPNLHKVPHTGQGVILRQGNTFAPNPKATSSNVLHVGVGGMAGNDGLSTDQPMALLSQAFSALRNYGPTLQGDWLIQMAAGTYNDQAINGTLSAKRLWISGPAVAPGETPVVIFEPGATSFTKAIGGNNGLVMGLRNIRVRNYKTLNVPAIDFSTHCDISMHNVWGTGNDTGYRVINQSKYRSDGCVWEDNTQYGGLELFGVVRDFKGAERPTVFRRNGKVGLKAKELCTGHLDDVEIYDNKHGVHFSRACTANGTNAKIYRNEYGVTLRNQSSFVALNVDWKFGTADINTVTPWDVEGSSSFVTNENEAISPSVFSGRGEMLLGSYAPEVAQSLTGTTATTSVCTFGNLRRGSLARPGGYVRTVIMGFKGGSSGTATVDFRFGGSSAGTIVLPAAARSFKIEVLVFSRGQGKQTVFATESLSGASPQSGDRAYDVNVSDYLMSARATLGSATDSLTVYGAWCYTTEALASEG